MSLEWWESLILTRYDTSGLLPAAQRHEAAIRCLAQIRMGFWRVFDYPVERVVAIVGDTNREGLGEVHIWGDEANLIGFGAKFMREVWEHTQYDRLVDIFADPRMERYVSHFGWRYVSEGEFGQRYWMIARTLQ